jgi:hypothetical protein
MDKHLSWKPANETGMERLHFYQAHDELIADGMIERQHIRARYRVICDLRWQTKEALVERLDIDRKLYLRKDSRGCWKDHEGRENFLVEGCIDVDISLTPFTNTLPIRRLDLKPGQSIVAQMAFMDAIDLEIRRSGQRYTCIDKNHYRYESLLTKEVYDLVVDDDGFVIEYAGLFVRI